MNSAQLIGRLGKGPTLEKTKSGVSMCRFSLATSEYHKDQDGKRAEKTTWHNLVVFRELADVCQKYLSKGSHVAVEGKIDNSSYEKDGVKSFYSQVVVNRLEFLDKKPASEPKEQSVEQKVSEKIGSMKQMNVTDYFSDNIPF